MVPHRGVTETQRAVKHIQQLQKGAEPDVKRGEQWRSVSSHVSTSLPLSHCTRSPFWASCPQTERSVGCWGEGRKNEGKWGGVKEGKNQKAGHSYWVWMDSCAKIDRDGAAKVVHVLRTRWPVAPSVSLKPAPDRSLSCLPLQASQSKHSPPLGPFTTLLLWKDESPPRKRYFIMLFSLILLLFILLPSRSETLSNVSKVAEIDRLVPL